MKDRIFPQSNTGLPRTESFPVHLVHFYDDGAFPDRSIADFLWTGLQADESAIIIATSEHMGALRECLTTRGAALHALERSGRLTALDAHATLEQLRGEGLPDRARLLSILSPTLDQATAVAPNGRWRMFGEMTALLAEEGNIGGSIELERLWNELFSTRSFRLYCAYPIRQFAHESLVEPFSQMCDEHDEVVPVLTWLDKPEHHGRWFAVLQQRARALQVEINERKQTEEALRQAEAKYRGIFENAIEGIFQSTPSGIFITANPALAHMLGYESPAELMAMITNIQAQLYVEPERRSEVTQLLEENDRQRYEVELYRKDGSTVWVSVHVRAVRDTSGQVLYYEGLAEDITERKRAQEELQRRADEFAALYDTARDLATQQDFSTLMQAIVERALSLLNLPSGGISLYDPTRGDLEVVFAKEKVVPLGTRVPFGEGITGRVAQSRQPLIINDFPTWKPGSPWLTGKGIKSLMSVPMLSGGELIGVLSVGEHKRERKFTDADARLLSLFAAQGASAIRNAHLLEETRTRAEQLAISEERTRLIVDSVYDAFIAIDANGLITDWNRQAEDTFGWSREEIMGQFLAETIIPAQHREAYKRGLESFLATGKGPMLNRRIEVTALHRDGHEFPAELTITPIRWRDSFIFSAFVHDITERKEAEEALRRSEAYLAEAQRLSHAGSWAWNVATREFVHWSQEHYRMYDLDPQRGMPSWEAAQQFIHPEDRTMCLERIDRAIRERVDCELDYRAVLPNGTIKYIHSIGHPVFNTSGDLVEFVGTEMDVTERKWAEEEHQAHLWFLESMDKVNRAMQGANDLEQMMSDVLDIVLTIFDCDRAWLSYPCEPEATSWCVPMERTRPEYSGAFAPGLDVPMDPNAAKVCQIVRASSGPVRFGLGSEYPLAAEVAKRLSIQSMMAMAVHPKIDKPYLFGLHQCSYPRVWTPEEERLLQEIGRRLADALTSLLMFRSLRESEAKLEEAQRIAHVGYWDRDYDADCMTLSDEACRIFGLLPQERWHNLAQWHQRWQELIHPEDRLKTAQAAAEALRDGPRYDVEYRVVRPNGEVRIVHSQGDVTWDELGRPRRMFGIMQDITELRQAGDELRASEARFRTFVDHATDAFFLHDDQGTILDLNRQACESLGYSREELIGMTPYDIDVDAEPTFLDQLGARLDAGEVVTFNSHHRRKDGAVFPVEVRIRPFWQGGRRFGVSLVRDITERKQAEEALRQAHQDYVALVNSIDGIVWEVDVQTFMFTFVSKKAERLLGYPIAQWLTEPTFWRDHIYLEDQEWAMNFCIKATQEKRDHNFEYRMIAADGPTVWLHDIVNVIVENNEPVKLRGVMVDITERKRAEEELRKHREHLQEMVAERTAELAVAKDRAEEADRLKSAFLATMSHELRTPLNSIIGFTGIMLQGLVGPLNKEQKKQLNIVKNSAHRLLNLINEVLDLSRIEAGQIELHLESFDMRTLIDTTVQTLKPLAGKKKLQLIAEVGPEVNRVISDPHRVEQLLINLVNNAIKFTEQGEVRIECRVRDGWLLTSVADTGIGIKPEDLAKLFTTFRQLDSTLARQHEGTGLGLAICQKLADLLGGEIRVESEWGVGSNFTFVLPLNR